MLWRYSLGTPTWRAGTVTSVDYSTMVMGYAINYLPDGADFYSKYAGLYKTQSATTTQGTHCHYIRSQYHPIYLFPLYTYQATHSMLSGSVPVAHLGKAIRLNMTMTFILNIFSDFDF